MAANNGHDFDPLCLFEVIDSAYYHAKQSFEDGTGVSIWAFRWLKSISEHPDYHAVQHTTSMRLTNSNKAYQLEQMEKSGWIERWRPKHPGRLDKRKVFYRLTSAGETVLKQVTSRCDVALMNLFAQPDFRHVKSVLMSFEEL